MYEIGLLRMVKRENELQMERNDRAKGRKFM